MNRIEKYKEILQFLELNVYNINCTVDFVCLELQISRSTLHRIIKSSTGMSATNYMNSIRLDRGYRLLLDGDQEIKNIALQVGFKDPKYFSKLFKKKFGIAPDNLLNNLPLKFK